MQKMQGKIGWDLFVVLLVRIWDAVLVSVMVHVTPGVRILLKTNIPLLAKGGEHLPGVKSF